MKTPSGIWIGDQRNGPPVEVARRRAVGLVRRADRRRSCRPALMLSLLPSRSQIAIEQHVAVGQDVNVGAGPLRIGEARDRAQLEPGLAAAEDHRRDHHVQAVDRAGVDELRDGPGAAFDQHRADAGANSAPTISPGASVRP